MNTKDRPAPETDTNEPARRTTAIAPVLLTVSQAAQALAVGRTTLYELIRGGELEAIRIGRSTRIPVDAIATYVDRQRRATSRPSWGCVSVSVRDCRSVISISSDALSPSGGRSPRFAAQS
jgi:excisionase family DNA binding protein